MIEEKLEIVIPTFNRAKYLDNTLFELLKSPFSNCKITIRNNDSTDETQKVCLKYQKQFKNLIIIKNKINIGGNANILRSYEQSSAKYIWVIADNDTYNFNECDDFINAINSEKYDLILCCSPGFPNKDGNSLNDIIKKRTNKSNYLENYAQELVEILKKYYFLSLGFISTSVYRRDLLNSDCFIIANNYISKSYPHYAFINKSIEDNFLIYKTKSDIINMEPNPDDWEIEHFTWIIRWIDCSLLIKNKKLQKYASQFFEGSPLKVSLGMLIIAKAKNEKNLKQKVMDLNNTFFKLKGWVKGSIYNILILLVYLIPKFICKFIYHQHNPK